MQCRSGCGACCIAPSIASPLPGMPQGKPAGVPCVQLTADLRCRLFASPERPAFCGGLKPAPDMCGNDRVQALHWLTRLEQDTQPGPRAPTAAPTPCGPPAPPAPPGAPPRH